MGSGLLLHECLSFETTVLKLLINYTEVFDIRLHVALWSVHQNYLGLALDNLT